jgi:4-hydroxybenzoyl-CoA thioesterase
MAHVVEIPVRFGHVDQARIVYYPHLFHFGHVAMEQTFRDALGISYPDLIAKERRGFPAVRIETDFMETVGYDETLKIAVSVTRVGTTSVTWRFDATRSSDGERAFRTVVTTVCVDMDTFRPTPVPDRLRAPLAALTPDGA